MLFLFINGHAQPVTYKWDSGIDHMPYCVLVSHKFSTTIIIVMTQRHRTQAQKLVIVAKEIQDFQVRKVKLTLMVAIGCDHNIMGLSH